MDEAARGWTFIRVTSERNNLVFGGSEKDRNCIAAFPEESKYFLAGPDVPVFVARFRRRHSTKDEELRFRGIVKVYVISSRERVQLFTAKPHGH